MAATADNLSQDKELKQKINAEIQSRFNKARWITITDLYYTLSRYGIPYGGCVRDYIVRTNAADSYYAFCKEQGIDANTNYNNAAIHKESYNSRNKIPNDIDIFITREKFEKLSKILVPKFNFKKKGTNPNYFFESCKLLKAALTHEKWILNLFNLSSDYVKSILVGCRYINKKYFELSIDFVIINDDYTQHEEYLTRETLYPPFGNPDFDVNLLSFGIGSDYKLKVMPLPYLKQFYPIIPVSTTNSERVSERVSESVSKDDPDKTKTILESVITNIKNNRARPIFAIKSQYEKVYGKDKSISINGYRIYKMYCKRYNIDFYNTILPTGILSICAKEKETTENTSSDSCMVCNEPFSDLNRAFNSYSKCPSKMHLACFRDILKKTNTLAEQPNYDKCPCELVNFLTKIIYNLDEKHMRGFTGCAACKKWYSECNCWFVKCNTCKLTPDSRSLETALEQ